MCIMCKYKTIKIIQTIQCIKCNKQSSQHFQELHQRSREDWFFLLTKGLATLNCHRGLCPRSSSQCTFLDFDVFTVNIFFQHYFLRKSKSQLKIRRREQLLLKSSIFFINLKFEYYVFPIINDMILYESLAQHYTTACLP